MDPTLTQILSALYQKDAALQKAIQENDSLKARIMELEERLAAVLRATGENHDVDAVPAGSAD